LGFVLVACSYLYILLGGCYLYVFSSITSEGWVSLSYVLQQETNFEKGSSSTPFNDFKTQIDSNLPHGNFQLISYICFPITPKYLSASHSAGGKPHLQPRKDFEAQRSGNRQKKGVAKRKA